MFQTIVNFLQEHISCDHNILYIHVVEILFIVFAAALSYYAMRAMEKVAMFFIKKTSTRWDDDLLNARFLKAFSQLMPAITVAWMLPKFFQPSETGYNWVRVLTFCYILWVSVYILCVFTDNLLTALSRRRSTRAYAVKGIFQMIKLLVVCIGFILTVSILIDRSPMSILISLGASAAILMLVFKDTILGLVASVQLTANKMLHKGDWIEVESHGANGEVIDISLTTVKVRNWDNSVTTVPPYSLISESFKNYQPMRRSGGRRIDRSVPINANSIRFCTPEELADLQAEGWLDGMELDQAAHHINLQLLRRYLERYLAQDDRVCHDMLTMVRQMEPTSTGIPLQLYFFTPATEWKEFEQVQSDIFDHVYAVVRRFGLSIYQITSNS
ncbi:MAG: mechanosensitive ion channel family protein [Bacteroides sp.]|nr:mechanosensitive ion channel family protein [Bacteroides sp.]MCM1413591.1 mechanosensitive ion channel family protein [Bacteroides sp.]MCM1471192.1 mechanosensitive ion channel family protein [Bacteroides sp.]